MKRIFIIYIFMILGMTGCESFLDKTDPKATTFQEFFIDEDDLRRVTYSSFYDVFTHHSNRRTLLYMKDGRSDNAYARSEDDHHLRIANGTINSNTRAFEYYYTLRLKHVGRLNTYIANIDVPYVEDEAVRARYKSILEGLRVWHYFELTARWGDVPFLLEPVTVEEATVEPTPKEEILNQLFQMSEDIADRLPPDEYTTNKYMFNKYSFKALVMRYALYNERYELAARLAREIMDSGNYSLHSSYRDLFQYEGATTNNEFIQHQDIESFSGSTTYSFRDLGPHFRTGNGESYCVPLKSLVDTYWTLQGRPIDECPLHTKEEYELDPKLNRDPRYEASIMGPGDEFYGETIDIYNPNNPMFYENQRASRSGYWFRKFVSEADAFRNGNLTYGLLRYAEVLLTYAEAKIMMNDVDNLAKSCINQVRERAGLDMTVADVTLPDYSAYSQQQWIDLIRNERRIEFAGEGLRYDDIIRWKIAEDMLNKPALGHTRMVNGSKVSLKIENRSFAPRNYLWPFHESSLKVNPNLKQNAGY
ncbi:RagB/SusD family nutrient uptake outer membrane protein [Sinomicrobium weinanense]|uniref:RagB/SusD family nutrient uptake outer membrane protein n=1 Tax=Sinomicrobium weinanense TaxID=2842200 RepID=A0A926JS81_9FLAO|nr:RagB/SusD family nutrient uptake outer membrane protein [Sinomicrobium weinanense]MBC9796560.1 RagB/SusD family nutrient uptake outer membrane protein [Sinomicrobium weinanense]MBU3123053.1 RagB/SusD family nutrient uptake outer membrane protein [Sinomicrobium weinanense]